MVVHLPGAKCADCWQKSRSGLQDTGIGLFLPPFGSLEVLPLPERLLEQQLGRLNNGRQLCRSENIQLLTRLTASSQGQLHAGQDQIVLGTDLLLFHGSEVCVGAQFI